MKAKEEASPRGHPRQQTTHQPRVTSSSFYFVHAVKGSDIRDGIYVFVLLEPGSEKWGDVLAAAMADTPSVEMGGTVRVALLRRAIR